MACCLLDLYKDYHAAEGGNENGLAVYNVQNICCMLQLSIPLKQQKSSLEKRYVKNDDALGLAQINAESDSHLIWRCASELRNDIFLCKINKCLNQSLLIT